MLVDQSERLECEVHLMMGPPALLDGGSTIAWICKYSS